LGEHPLIKSARQMLEYRKQLEEKKKSKPEAKFDIALKGLLNTPHLKRIN